MTEPSVPPSRGANRLKRDRLTDDERGRIRAVCPSFVPGADTVVNYKVALNFGATASGPAVAKVLRKSVEGLVVRFAHEVQAYTCFRDCDAPFPTPQLRGADPESGVLVISLVDGVSATTDRYPSAIDSDVLDSVMEFANTLQEWGSLRGPWPEAPPIEDTIARQVERSILAPYEADPLLQAAREIAADRTLAHGDLLLQNVLVQPDGSITIIDWEHVGLRPRHYDLAMLWSTLGDLPEARTRIQTRIWAENGDGVLAFLLNAAVANLQEIYITSRFDPTPGAARRLEMLREDQLWLAEQLMASRPA